MLNQTKKKQMIDFVSGGVLPAHFSVGEFFDKINQKRNIQLMNLITFLKKRLISLKNKLNHITKTIKIIIKKFINQ